jgi:hypothetical protein
LDHDPPIYASCVSWDDRSVLCAQLLLVEMGYLRLFA